VLGLKDKKGFLFVVIVFLIMAYILTSLSLWVKAVESSERAYSEFYKESNVELLISQITSQKVNEISGFVMNRALYNVTLLSVDHPIKSGPSGNPLMYVNRTFYEFAYNGSPAGSNFEDGASPASDYSSSLSAWIGNLNSSLAAVGAYVDSFYMYNFNISQNNYSSLNYTFKVYLSVRDLANQTAVARVYDVKGVLDISGTVDPALKRESGGDIAARKFYFGPYNNPLSLQPTKIDSSSGGQGWFYGPLVSTTDVAKIPVAQRHLFILVGTYKDIIALSGTDNYLQFGAFILTNDTEYSASPCSGTLNYDEKNTFNPITYTAPGCAPKIVSSNLMPQPYVIVKDFKVGSGGDCPDFTSSAGKKNKCALILSTSTHQQVLNDPKLKNTVAGAGVFNVEKARDFTMCGYYVNSKFAPSYIQRLFKDSYSYTDEKYGIETFVIGQYANTTYDGNSRLDREIFNSSKKGEFIRGMPGCRNFDDCSDTPSVGIFGLSTNAITDYGFDSIKCSILAGCK